MEEITGNEAEKAREQYENLFIELIREEDLLPSQRNQDYFDDTCKLFLDRGLSRSDHMSWRTKNMVPEMRSLLHERHKAMNPWKYDEYIHVNTPWPDSEEPTSPEEFPVFNRQELEILAAQEFLYQSLGRLPKINDIGTTLQPKLKNVKNDTMIIKRRKGNLEDLEAIDLFESGLSAEDIVDHWKGLNPDEAIKKDKNEDEIDWLKRFRDAVTQAKTEWMRHHGDNLILPLRISKANRGRWRNYALAKEGRPGSGGGNEYGIIKDEKTI